VVSERRNLDDAALREILTRTGLRLEQPAPVRLVLIGAIAGLLAGWLRAARITAKVMGAPQRPHDLEDLRDMTPTGAELDDVEVHLERLKAESLDNASFEAQFAVVKALREQT
jgi:hypothetical protein